MLSWSAMDSLTAYRLMRTLARESREDYEWDQAYEIVAEEFSMELRAVEKFHHRYLDVIEEIEQDLFPDMWITSKEKRMQDYQRDVDKYNQILEYGWDKAIALEKRYIKRYVAEELGQLPSRMGASNDDEDTTLGYTIDGVDLGELR